MRYMEKHPMIMIVGAVLILGGVLYYSRVESGN